MNNQQLALYLKIAKDSRDRQKQKFIMQFGASSEAVRAINAEIQLLNTTINFLQMQRPEEDTPLEAFIKKALGEPGSTKDGKK